MDGSEIESIDKLPRNNKREKAYEKPDHIKLDMTGDNSDQDSNSSDRSITKSLCRQLAKIRPSSQRGLCFELWIWRKRVIGKFSASNFH